MSLLSLLKRKLNPQWEVWKEIPPEGDLEYKLGEFPSEPREILNHMRSVRDLLGRVYASVKEECLRDNPDKVHVIVLSPYSPTGNHLLLTYPSKVFDDKAWHKFRELGYDGPTLYHQPEHVEPFRVLNPFFFK